MLSALPTEILLEIIQWLPSTTLALLPALSKSWITFMDTNESSIYHTVSKRYGYFPNGGSDAAPPQGWKVWCECPLVHQRCQPNDDSLVIHKLQTELRWIGKLPTGF